MNNKKQGLKEFFAGRNFASALLVALVIASVVFVNIIAYTVTSFFGLYIYSPEEEDLSISDASEKLFAEAIEAGKTVSVTFCMDKKELSEHTSGSFVHKTAEEFKKKYPDFIRLNYVNVYTKLYSGSEEYEDGEMFDANIYKNYKDTADGDREYAEKTVILPSSVIFEYVEKNEAGVIVKRNYRVLTDAYTTVGFGDFYTLNSNLVMTSYNGEEVFSAMAAWVLRDYHPTAYITVGHGEVADFSLASALSCAGYHIGYVDLKRESVPSDAGLVVISSPRNDFERSSNPNMETEISRLEAYKEQGGNLFVTIDPYSRKLPVLESFIAGYGISVDKNESGSRYMIKDTNKGIALDGFTLVADHSSDARAQAMLAKTGEYGGNVILRDVASLSLSGEAKPLLVASSAAVCEADGVTVDDNGGYTMAAYSSCVSDSGERSVICFIPSVYLTASDAMITNGYANKNFLYSVFGELYGEGNMPYGARSITFNNYVLENLTMGSAKLYTALFLAVPVVIMLAGAVVLRRRKNR